MNPFIEHRDARRTIGIALPVTMSTIATVADRLPGLFAALGTHGVEPAGPPFFRYHVIDAEGAMTVEAGVPVADDLDPADAAHLSGVLAAEPGAAIGVLPAGRYAVLRHHGHPDELMDATRRLLEWAQTAGIEWDAYETPEGTAWGCRLESYLTDPEEEPDMAQWDTELAFRLAG